MSESFKVIQNKPVMKLNSTKLNLALSRHIRDRPGLVGASITGRQQSGKSAYALMVMYELYQGNIDEIFKHIVFNIQDLTELLNDAIQKNERMICILWDDSSVSGGAGMYNIDRQLVQYLSAMGDTMGLATKGILLTSPSGDIVKAFRNYNFYKVQVHFGKHKYDRIARGYEFGSSPFGQRWVRTSFEDSYDVRIPFYERYYALRKQLSISTLTNMDTFINSSSENQEEEPPKPKMIKDIVAELHRDWEAGVFGEMTFKDICKAHKINYRTAVNCVPA